MWRWSCRAWAVSVALEFGRLVREWVLRGQELQDWHQKPATTDGGGDADGGGDKDDRNLKNQTRQPDNHWHQRRAEFLQKWTTQLCINACYAPMTLHYSLEKGIMSEGILSLLGTVASVLAWRQAWREVGDS